MGAASSVLSNDVSFTKEEIGEIFKDTGFDGTLMFSLLENGVPVETLVDIMQTGGVMEGLHSLDVGIVITPALVEVVSQMATQAEVDFKQQTEVEKDTMNDSEIKSILREIEDVPYPTPEPVAEEPEVEEEPKGLMARRAM